MSYHDRLSGKETARAEVVKRLAWAAEVGAMLKEQREFKGVRQSELAQLTMIDQGTISLFERGQSDLSFGRVRSLLNAVGLDIAITELTA